MESRTGEETLTFDTAFDADRTGGQPAADRVSCAGCGTTIDQEYFDVNGQSVCAPCNAQIAEHAETPRGWTPLVKALVFGFGARRGRNDSLFRRSGDHPV